MFYFFSKTEVFKDEKLLFGLVDELWRPKVIMKKMFNQYVMFILDLLLLNLHCFMFQAGHA